MARQAKVTDEHRREAERLAQLWAERAHPAQAEFGETYGIGNQSAVSKFLRGETPLSMKAAEGFAKGLNCRLEDFSPRLAEEAARIADMARVDLSPEVLAVARRIEQFQGRKRTNVLSACRIAINLATNGDQEEVVDTNESDEESSHG